MLVKLIIKLFKINIKNNFYSPYIVLVEIFSILISLTIYWYTSKAFNLKLTDSISKYGHDYFHYLLLGEIFLSIPLTLLSGFIKKTKMLIIEGTFETFISMPVNLLKPLILLNLSDLLIEIFQIFLTLVLAYLLFGFEIPFINILQAISIIIFTLPIFVAIGIVATSVLLIFGRGDNFIGYISTLAAFGSGAFFPIDVFPEIFQKLVTTLSPYTIFLQLIRNISNHGFSNIGWNSLQVLILWNLLIIPSILIFNYSLKIYKKNGGFIVFTS